MLPSESAAETTEMVIGEPGSGRVTIDDVARRAGVSVSTVSRALRDLPNVAHVTRDRVLLAATELRYVADPAASRLAGGPIRSLGVVVPGFGSWRYARTFAGVEEVVSEAGYDLLTFRTTDAAGVERFVSTLPFRKSVDGLVLVDPPLDERHLEVVAGAGVPLVTVGMLTPGITGLATDEAAAVELLVDHLAGLGHRRIALICAGGGRAPASAIQHARVHGYRRAVVTFSAIEDPRLVVHADPTAAGGAGAMGRLLCLDEPASAVVACSDEMAVGAISVARRAGLPVPDAVSVAGIDDHELAEHLDLTTVAQDALGQGRRAARLLLDALEHPVPAVAHERCPVALRVRSTTGPAPVVGDSAAVPIRGRGGRG